MGDEKKQIDVFIKSIEKTVDFFRKGGTVKVLNVF